MKIGVERQEKLWWDWKF